MSLDCSSNLQVLNLQLLLVPKPVHKACGPVGAVLWDTDPTEKSFLQLPCAWQALKLHKARMYVSGILGPLLSTCIKPSSLDPRSLKPRHPDTQKLRFETLRPKHQPTQP